MHPPSAEPDWQEIAGAMVAPPLELTKALRKTLSSVGHLVENFAAACERLRARVDEGLMPELRPWLRRMADDKSCALNGDGLIICPLRMEGGKIHFHSHALPVAHSATVIDLWKRVQPDAMQALPPLLPFAESPVNSPLWPALIRLRPLRDFWERELRRSAVENLLALLPEAWLMDPAPLPPGAVIPGLDLANWFKLTALHGSTRKFVLSSVTGEDAPLIMDDSLSALQWQQALDTALSHAADHPRILTEHPALSSDTKTIFSFHHKNGTRVNWLGAIVISSVDAGHHLHRII